MGAGLPSTESESAQVEGLKNLMIGDLKHATAPQTPPRADEPMDVCHDTTAGEHGDASDRKWQVLPRNYELSDFQPIKKLYRGYASKVYLAHDIGKLKHQGHCSHDGGVPGSKEKHPQVVLKVYDLLRLSPLTKYQLDREIAIHSSIRHKNIIRLEAAFTQTDFAILVQDFAANGDLYSYLHKQRTKFSERKVIQGILLPCMDALAYLHARNIAHRDIKPENLLLDSDNNIKLADFGLSVCIGEENAVTRAGTMDYMAPEVLICPLKRLPTDYKDRKDLAYSVKVDSWSLGVLAFEMLAGRTPFRHRDEDDMLRTIKTTEIKFPSTMSSLARDWIQRAMTLDVRSRASVHDLASHAWITTNSSHSSFSAHSHLSPHGRTRAQPSVSDASSIASSVYLGQQPSINTPSLSVRSQDSLHQRQDSASRHSRSSTIQKDMIGAQHASTVESSQARDELRAEETRIPKAPPATSTPTKTGSTFMQHISALKPAIFGSFRDKTVKDGAGEHE